MNSIALNNVESYVRTSPIASIFCAGIALYYVADLVSSIAKREFKDIPASFILIGLFTYGSLNPMAGLVMTGLTTLAALKAKTKKSKAIPEAIMALSIMTSVIARGGNFSGFRI